MCRQIVNKLNELINLEIIKVRESGRDSRQETHLGNFLQIIGKRKMRNGTPGTHAIASLPARYRTGQSRLAELL